MGGMKRKSKSKKKRLALSVLFIGGVIFLLSLVFFRENVWRVLEALQKADYSLVMLAIGIYLFGLFLWALRWRISLRALGYPRPIHKIYTVILGGIFVTNVTPLTYAGGDPIARTYLSKKVLSIPYPVGLATIIVEILIDLPIFLSFLMISLAILTGELWLSILIIAGWLVLLELLVSLLYYLVHRKMGATGIKRFALKIFRALRRKVKEKPIREAVGSFYLACDFILGRFRVAGKITIFALLLWFCGMARLFLVFLALGYISNLPMLMLAVTLPSIVGLLPLLPGGIGTVDATLISVFLLFNAPLEVAASAVLIDRGITLILGTLVGAVVVSSLGLKKMSGR